jgi:long-chain acyl-CoA synthetase
MDGMAAGLWTPAGLLRGLAARGDAPAVLGMAGETPVAHSGASLAADALRFAGGLRAAGVEPGTPFGIYAPNSPRWMAARLGLSAAGLLPIALDDLAPEEEARAILDDAGATWLLASRAHAEGLRRWGLDAGLRIILLEEDDGWRSLFASEPAEPHDPTPDEPAMLVYTSGTTGAPKGFVLTHANLHANLVGILGEGQAGPEDRFCLPLPLHHVYPFLLGLMVPLAAGATIVLPEAVTGPQLVAALKHGRCTIMVGVPRLYTALLTGMEARVASRGAVPAALFRTMLKGAVAARKRGLDPGKRLFGALHRQLAPDLRLMVSGGARLEEEAAWKIEAMGWRLLNGYGLAETASIFTGNVPHRFRVGSEGQPVAPGSEIRIADPETLATLPAGTEGEIQLRGANVFAGYRNRPEINAEVFTEDRWFRTGDLGHLDADGFVHVTGRLKEMLVLGGGKNVFPDPLERHYATNPLIREIAVLERGGALVAIVVPQDPAVPRLEDALRVWLAEAARDLPSWQRLAGFAIAREALPRTRLQKIQRFRLPALYDALKSGAPRTAAAMTAEGAALVAAPGAREVWALLRARDAEAPAPSLDAHPMLDLGLDSLAWLTLAVEIEARTGLRLSEAEMASFGTLRELLQRAAEGPKGEAPVDAAEVARWTTPPSAAAQPLRRAAWAANRAACRALFSLRAEGVEHVPASGPFVIVANHVSDLDPALIPGALPYAIARRLWFGGTTDRLFGSATARAALRLFQTFPVEERAAGRSLAMARAVLARGDALVWFPESWRSPDGELQRFLPGIGLILDGAGDIPVVPARIIGAFEAMPRHARLPRRHPVTVRFGAPLRAIPGEGAAATADRLREAVAALG